MTRVHLILRTTLALVLAAAPVSARDPEDPASALTPAAQPHNARGVTAFLAHDHELAISELARAYAAMPDPVVHRTGRDLVLSSLRSVHLERYKQSGRRVDLCAAWELQRVHTEALRLALGEAGDIAGPQRRLDELAAKVAQDFPDAPRCDPPISAAASPPVPQRPVMAERPPRPEPLHPPIDDTTRRARRFHAAGGALLGVAGLAAVGSASAAGVYADRYRRLDALDREVRTPAEIEQVERLANEGRLARTTAIVMGVGGALLLVAGAAVLMSAPRRPARVSVAPSLTPISWGLHVRGRF